MKCNECKFCVLEDYGYSNYTVEGTDADCLLDMNPFYPADNWYGDAEAHDFANVCPRFKEGNPIEIDVDHENGHIINYAHDGEVYAMLERDYMWKKLKEGAEND